MGKFQFSEHIVFFLSLQLRVIPIHIQKDIV